MLDKETRVFAQGGMDSNTAPEYIENPDFLDATELRTISADDNWNGYAMGLEGTVPRTNPNTVTGDVILKARFFPEIDRIIQFIYNPSGEHRIDEYNPLTRVFTTLIGGSVLKFNQEMKVKDIKLVDSKYILWNDALNEVGMINRGRALNGEYVGAVEEEIRLVKAQPADSILAEYVDDGQENMLKGSLFQFRSQFIYEDGQVSAWSPISQRPVPESESGVGFSDENNAIRLTVPAGNKRVEEVIVAAREGDGDWFVINRRKRQEILDLPNVDFPPIGSPNTEYYAPSTNRWVFLFRNDSVYEFVDVLETDLLADYIPRQAKALEVINKNIVALGSTLEGYERPTTQASINPVVIPIGDVGTGAFDVYNWNTITNPPGAPESTSHIDIQFENGDPLAGTTVYATFVYLTSGIPRSSNTVSYTFSASDIAGGIGVALRNMMEDWRDNQGLTSMTDIDETQNSTGWFISFNLYTGWTESFYYLENPSVLNPTLSDDIVSTPSLKSRTSYKLALAHYDAYGRPFPIVTHPNFEITTPTLTGVGKIGVEWDITGETPPEGATTYRWLMTHNTRFLKWVDTLAVYDETKSTTDTVVFNITALLNYGSDNTGSPVTYDFTEGDRVYIKRIAGGTADVLVRKVEIEAEDYFLYTEAPSDITFSLGDAALLEIYTPRKSSSDTETEVYYEVGDTYHILNGNYTTLTGTIAEGDSYIKRRIMDGGGIVSSSTIVEDPHFSDYYISNYYSYGRPRTYYDTPENYLAKARVRYSREFIKGERVDINNISRFYGENYEDYEDIYGNIWYLSVRGNRLVCVQEKNTGYIGVERQIIEDAIGQQNIAVSERLLNNIDYTRGENTGIGNAVHSFVDNFGTSFFVDPMREEVVRVDTSGILSIGRTYSNKIKTLIRETKDTGSTSLVMYEGMYNNKYDEYMIEFKSVSNPETLIFSNILNKWQCRSVITPSCGMSAENRFFTAKNGVLYEHDLGAERAQYYGVQYKPTIKLVINKIPDLVKTFQTITIQSDELFLTTESGIETQLGHVTDLVEEDFEDDYLLEKEGSFRANFPRAYPDPVEGDRLKGRYLIVNLEAQDPDFKLFKVTVVFSPSLAYT